MSNLSDENRYNLLKLLDSQSELTQRQIASKLGLSLGKVNYCLKSLSDVGLIKAIRFYKSPNKKAYLYILTPAGIEEKVRVTLRFLAKKQQDYERLQLEIDEIQKEAKKSK